MRRLASPALVLALAATAHRLPAQPSPAALDTTVAATVDTTVETRAAPRADSAALLPPNARVIRVGDREYVYTRPGWTAALRGLPGDFSRGTRSAFAPSRAMQWLALTAGTAALIAVDQPLVNEAQRFGTRIHLSKNHDMVDLVKIPIPFAGKDFPIRGPSTFSSFLYFMGDGWSSILTVAGFGVTGAFTKDSRALRTASEVAESFLATGITAQILKHSFGRETPSEQQRNGSHDGGRWRPFPSWSAYSGNVPGYDAFPRGHLSTVMSTVSVVALNYPEKSWIRPVGYSAMSVLAFQMMNNGVHWASDYPIAIAFGDLFAHIVVARGRAERAVGGGASGGEASSGSRRFGLDLAHPHLAPRFGPYSSGLGIAYDW